MRLSRLLILGLLSLLIAAPATAQALVRCGPEIDKVITSLDIPDARIRDVSTLNIYGASAGGGRIDHVEGWVSFHDCRGNLVISVSTACQLKDVYTTYQCRVPNVKHY